MIERFKLMWQAWGLLGEMEKMDSKALVKVLVAILLGFGGSVGTAFLTHGWVPGDLMPAIWAGLAAGGAYLKQSPVGVPNA